LSYFNHLLGFNLQFILFAPAEKAIGTTSAKIRFLFETVNEMIKKYRGRHVDFNRDYIFLDAKAMLRASKYTVKEIADELRFSNTSFPRKYFREAVGCSLLSH
jgi:hypothetical protein